MNPESNISKFQMRNLFGLLAQRNAVDMAEQKFIAEVEKVHSGSAVHFELKKKHAHILVLPNKKVTSLDSLKKYVEQYPINFVIANDENMTQVKRKLSSFDT